MNKQKLFLRVLMKKAALVHGGFGRLRKLIHLLANMRLTLVAFGPSE